MAEEAKKQITEKHITSKPRELRKIFSGLTAIAQTTISTAATGQESMGPDYMFLLVDYLNSQKQINPNKRMVFDVHPIKGRSSYSVSVYQPKELRKPIRRKKKRI